MVIPTLTERQLQKMHNSPDGWLAGREILLATWWLTTAGKRRFDDSTQQDSTRTALNPQAPRRPTARIRATREFGHSGNGW
jgi:hypothetical protein